MKKESKKAIYARYGIKYKNGKILAPVFGYIRPLLVDGNAKIGKGAFHFSMLPTNRVFVITVDGKNVEVHGTCPCACIGCYATKGNYRFQSVIKALAIRTILAREHMDFVKRAIMAQIEADKIDLCRIHAAGDFFSLAYAEMWHDIAKAFPAVLFWTYTKNREAENVFDDFEGFCYYCINGETVIVTDFMGDVVGHSMSFESFLREMEDLLAKDREER